MTASQLRIIADESAMDEADESLSKQFEGRESEELVIGFSGPLGSGVEKMVEALTEILEQARYKVVRFKLSDYIKDAVEKELVAVPIPRGSGELARRYSRLQDGDELRKAFSNDVLAEWAVRRIAKHRTAPIVDQMPDGALAAEAVEKHVPERTAYLIEQLKHPDEVKLLRAVYRNIFFLIGVLSVEDRRRKRLESKGMKREDAVEAMKRDQAEPEEHGQQLDKTLLLADFFVRNDRENVNATKDQLVRFVRLMHGFNGITPTRDEFGMYLAYAAGLGSACLSRQVGAAILDTQGNAIGTGCNDVPRRGGGLYSCESGDEDSRCVKKEEAQCWNAFHKRKLQGEIADILETLEKHPLPPEQAAAAAAAIHKQSRIKDLIEFSRAVHAEMEAIISVARKAASGLQGSTLYATTFPCHSCARHIVAAGIRRVFYLEPYEKSLALELHGDSITLETDGGQGGERPKVEFVHFEGVAPRKYVGMFLQGNRKDKNGFAVRSGADGARKMPPEYLDSYRVFEGKVMAHWDKIGAEPRAELDLDGAP